MLRLRSKTNRESVEGRPTEADIKYEETFINKQRKSKKTKRLKGGLADYKRISFS